MLKSCFIGMALIAQACWAQSWVESSTSTCMIPPKYWCSSPDIARRCGVEHQCAEWNARFSPERRRFGAKPVNVTIYFESLCPDCQQFFLKQVSKARKVLSDDMLVLDFVPYGNAKMHEINKSGHMPAYSFQCQHGPDECVGNVFETCAMHVLKKPDLVLKYILCVENRTFNGEGIKPAIFECAKFDIPTSMYDSFLHCGKGHMGNALEGEMGHRTESLAPKHQFVPWVTFNGAGSETISMNAINDLVKVACSFYTGPGKCPPSAL